jgi:hypothetical protein
VRNVSVLSVFSVAYLYHPAGIHQRWIPASAGMTEGFGVFTQALPQE